MPIMGTTEIGSKMTVKALLASIVAAFGIALAASLTQINMLNEQLAEPAHIEYVTEQVRTIDTVEVEVIKEVPVEVIKYVPQVQTETVYVEVPVVEQVTSTETVYLNTLPPCEQEDSDNCYWDAAVMGNGTGDSFVTLNGVTYYN